MYTAQCILYSLHFAVQCYSRRKTPARDIARALYDILARLNSVRQLFLSECTLYSGNYAVHIHYTHLNASIALSYWHVLTTLITDIMQ